MTKRSSDARQMIQARSQGQEVYIESIKNKLITLCSGLPGTGKTFLAVAIALQRINDKSTEKIIITRPVVEAGEKLGYLPGDYKEKTYPYLQPIYDHIRALGGKELCESVFNNKSEKFIEVAPLAYMRGRTFDNSFMILDEAQNATLDQIKMFISRMGKHSKVVVCGDPRQSDLRTDGFTMVMKHLDVLPYVGVCRLGPEDIVRHEKLAEIIGCIENAEMEIMLRREANRNRHITMSENGAHTTPVPTSHTLNGHSNRL